MHKFTLEIDYVGWNTQQNCLKTLLMHIIITCLKMFISKRYNRLYDERIYLNLNNKTLEVATSGVLKISTTEAALILANFSIEVLFSFID